jgi:RNA polymerase primary sigma factor
MSKKSNAALAASTNGRSGDRKSPPLGVVGGERDGVVPPDEESEEELAPTKSADPEGELVVLEEEFDFEDTAEAEADDRPPTPVKAKADEGGGDSMLARYFREMATHPVMGQEEELGTAVDVEKAEVEHWCAILAFIPAAEHALDTLEADLPKDEEAIDVPQLNELRKYCKTYKKQRNKLTKEQEKKYRSLSESLARAIRLADSDRLWIAHAEEVVRKLGDPTPIEDVEEEGIAIAKAATPTAEAPNVANTTSFKKYLASISEASRHSKRVKNR